MNWDQIEGEWKEVKGKIREKWGKLTDDDLAIVGGKREKLAGLLQKKYGITKEEVRKQLADFERNF